MSEKQEKEFEAVMKVFDTKVGDEIETTNGDVVKIKRIDRIQVISENYIFIYGIGKLIKV